MSLSGVMLHFVILVSQEPEGQTKVSLNKPIDFLPSAECCPELTDHTVIFFLPQVEENFVVMVKQKDLIYFIRKFLVNFALKICG